MPWYNTLEIRARECSVSVEKQCLTCGKPMTVKPSLTERAKYCSRDCAKTGWKGQHRSPDTEFYTGMRGTRWNGGVTYSKGYRFLMRPDHPRANPNGYVAEHILVWESGHNQLLPADWCVHHFNGVKNDNRFENLIGLPRRQHHPALDPGYIKERVRDLERQLAELQVKYDALLRSV